MATRKDLRIGDIVELELPFSEVCTHMKVAGQKRKVKIVLAGAQILEADGSNFSFPVGYGEAGVYQDTDGFYVYE